MKIIDVVQGSPEWFAARCGIPSASNFDKLLQNDGKVSKQRNKYLYRMVGETLTGISEETYQNNNMLRGKILEGEAKEFYKFTTDSELTDVGFCLDEGGFGASPDSLVNDDGLLEVKCPIMTTHINYLINGGLDTEYFQQCQGQLLVTGRKWCDLMSYYPGIRPVIIRIYPDEKFQKALKANLIELVKELKEIVERLR